MSSSLGIDAAPKHLMRSRWRWSDLIDVLVVFSIPLAVLLASEGILRPMLPTAVGVGLLWMVGLTRWMLGEGSGGSRLFQPVPIAAVVVLALALVGRVAEAPFHLSESTLESHAVTLLAESDAAESTPQSCRMGDEVQRFGALVASVSCLPGQVEFKTSVRPGVGDGTQITGFIYVAEPHDAPPYRKGPCDWNRLSVHFYQYSCWQFRN